MSEETNITGETDTTEENSKQTYKEIQESYDEDAEVLEDLTTGVNYEKSKDKYHENMSTAITFLVFGIAGIAVVVLNIIGVLKFFSLRNASGILMTIVTAAMFIIFIIIGISSFVAAGKNKKNVKVETDNSQKVMEWLENNINIEDIDKSFNSEELSEEMRYFGRSDYLKDKILAQFDGLDDEFVDSLTEQFIENHF